ncbi:hypothetical protein N658DRAFT_457906, partial [Parathielavia hyrcaniae]
ESAEQNTFNSQKDGRPLSSAGTTPSRSKRRSQSTRVLAQRLGKKHKGARTTRSESLPSRLVRRDAIECFANNFRTPGSPPHFELCTVLSLENRAHACCDG